MSSNPAPNIICDRQHPLLRVDDITEAVEFYTNKLGFTLGFTWADPPTLAGVNLGSISVHLAKGSEGFGRGSVYFVVGDADELYDYHRSNGVEINNLPADQPYGLRDYSILDPYGNELGFGHYIYHGEPLKIERVDVHVRLEKRLAALLQDLAEHKHMSLGSCMEETFLHTFEPIGDNVASPHTKRTLNYIQELKKKHGIDYDTHASYNFVE
jgi:catechol 2,3-dioxygenase-like lactoylglutathione lyase family enzyme